MAYGPYEGLLVYFPTFMYQKTKSMGVLLPAFMCKGMHLESLVEPSLAYIATL